MQQQFFHIPAIHNKKILLNPTKLRKTFYYPQNISFRLHYWSPEPCQVEASWRHKINQTWIWVVPPPPTTLVKTILDPEMILFILEFHFLSQWLSAFCARCENKWLNADLCSFPNIHAEHIFLASEIYPMTCKQYTWVYCVPKQ